MNPVQTAGVADTTNPEDVVWSLPEGPATASTTVSLLVLAHAGGNAHAYAEWREHLPANVRLLIGQYPGRGARFADPLPTSVVDLAGPVLDCLPPDTGELVVLGHSMGSLVAFEVAKGLTGRGMAPRALIASACRAPHLPNQAPVHPEALDDDALVAAVKARGGTTDGILDDPELREIVLPSLRADFALDDVYQYQGEQPALDCPVAVFGGDADPIVPVGMLPGWRAATTGEVTVEVLPGDHFYFQQQLPRFLALVTAVIDGVTRP